MTKKIAVIAGTRVDTEQGKQLLEKHFSNELVSYPVSKSPEEQTYFQTMDSKQRFLIIEAMIKRLILEEQVAIFFIYCNSLSASVDFDALATKYQVPILTPFVFYKEVARKYSRIGVLSANAQGAAGIERVIVQANSQSRVYAISNLDWVDSVEKQIPLVEFGETQGVQESIQFFEKNQVERIIFGCTHFPYFFEEYQRRSTIKCLNADSYLIEKIYDLLSCK
ncbi:hypothetical protein IGI37_001264 [Enterococcus sp. AZ194]|uniref:aspartate/glutamate racemase family protein n=1 Tax=Enterococcus sp. AZ194 TaxID=2774629 RepID=UPI003F27BECB